MAGWDDLMAKVERHMAEAHHIASKLTPGEASALAAEVREKRLALQLGEIDRVGNDVFDALLVHFAPRGLAPRGLDRLNAIAVAYQVVRLRGDELPGWAARELAAE